MITSTHAVTSMCVHTHTHHTHINMVLFGDTASVVFTILCIRHTFIVCVACRACHSPGICFSFNRTHTRTHTGTHTHLCTHEYTNKHATNTHTHKQTHKRIRPKFNARYDRKLPCPHTRTYLRQISLRSCEERNSRLRTYHR